MTAQNYGLISRHTDGALLRQARRSRIKACRTRQVRRQLLMIAALAAVCALCVCFLLFGTLARASEEETAPAYKYYTSVMIGAGESLQSVAEKYRSAAHYGSAEDYLDEVRAINHLRLPNGAEKAMTPGDCVILPYYSAEFIR